MGSRLAHRVPRYGRVANVPRVDREPILFQHRCGALGTTTGHLPDRLQALLTIWVANVSPPRVARKRIAMRVLLIEDDSAIAQSIELMLKSESFNVYTTDLGEEGVDLGKLYDYDIILLDLNLPDMPGFEVLRSLRVSKVKTPILILSGLAGIEDKVSGLGYGADDYMTKPFHRDELVARIHAIMRRSKGHAQSVIQTGDLVVNLDTKMVDVNGARVHLTAKEYQILELLSLRKGTTLTKEMFLNHLYGGMDEPMVKIIDVFMCKLRKKLASASDGKDYIETAWGRGYVLREPTEARIPA
jgi:two-component system, cell cycle response regulator CtrA